MASLSAVGKTSVAPELHRERERSALDLEEITNLVDGGESETERRRRMCERPVISCKSAKYSVP